MFNKKKKDSVIFYVRTNLDAYDLAAGGSVAHTLGVLEGFLLHNKRVMCASAAMVPLLQKVPIHGLCVLKMPKILARLGYRINSFLSNVSFTIKSLWFIRGQSIEFVYQRYSLLSCTGLIIARLKRVPLVLEFNGSEYWIDKNWVGGGRIRILWLIRWTENLNLRYARSVIVVSQVLKDDLVAQGWDGNKIVVNPNGVDTEKFNPAVLVDQRDQIRDQLGLHDKFVFGFVGTFSAWHGIETLAAMIPVVCNACPHAHFLLIGSGPLQGYLKDELEKVGIGPDKVTLPGSVPQAQAKNYLAACDAFLSPTKPNSDGSRFFGSPTKMFEYMSLGKPIIASELEQLSELLAPAMYSSCLEESCTNKVGVLVPPYDITGFIHAAVALACFDKSACEELGVNARRKAIEQYSWRDHTGKILKSLAR
jgi:glycosyltransferase involved in cell wall biosynthesis